MSQILTHNAYVRNQVNLEVPTATPQNGHVASHNLPSLSDLSDLSEPPDLVKYPTFPVPNNPVSPEHPPPYQGAGGPEEPDGDPNPSGDGSECGPDGDNED